MGSHKKVFWKNARNLQENNYDKMRFQQNCFATLLKSHFDMDLLLHRSRQLTYDFFLILLCLFSFVVLCFNFFSLFYCVHFAFVFILFSICFNCFFHFVHFHYLIFIINFSLLHLFLFFSFQFVFWNESKWKSSGQ